MAPNTLENIVEALLFASGEPLSITQLARLTGERENAVKAALETLKTRLLGGITMVRTETSAALAVAPGFEEKITELLGDPENREIGQAGLEVLSIILYQGPATRAKIDYIRGVNSTSSIRTLLMRGLIERTKGKNEREIIYQPTIDVLTHLGVRNASELPDAEELRTSLEDFLKREEKSAETSEEHQ